MEGGDGDYVGSLSCLGFYSKLCWCGLNTFSLEKCLKSFAFLSNLTFMWQSAVSLMSILVFILGLLKYAPFLSRVFPTFPLSYTFFGLKSVLIDWLLILCELLSRLKLSILPREGNRCSESCLRIGNLVYLLSLLGVSMMENIWWLYKLERTFLINIQNESKCWKLIMYRLPKKYVYFDWHLVNLSNLNIYNIQILICLWDSNPSRSKFPGKAKFCRKYDAIC